MVPAIVIGVHPKRREPEPIELAVKLSRLTHAPIDVVGTFWFDTTPRRTAADDYAREISQDVQEALAKAVGDPDRACGEIRFHGMSGSPAHALHEKASEVGAGLIVVGSTHRGAIGRIATGTTTDRVLNGPPCPVAVVPRGFRDDGMGAERVGVAFVDTPGGRAAMRAAAAIARHTGAALTAYTVIESHAPGEDRQRAEQAVERAIAKHAHDIPAEARVLSDGGVDALVRESRELGFLLRGSRGSGSVVRAPLAFDVVSRLARQVECPFVVVPPGLDEPLVALFGAHSEAGRHEALAS